MDNGFSTKGRRYSEATCCIKNMIQFPSGKLLGVLGTAGLV